MTHSYTFGWSSGNQSLSGGVSFTGTEENEVNIDYTVPISTTDGEVPCAINHTNLQAFYMISDQPIRVCFNDTHSGSPLLTENLLAGVPWFWAGQGTSPITSDLTALYVTNASGSNIANFKVRSISNP